MRVRQARVLIKIEPLPERESRETNKVVVDSGERY